MPRKEIAAVHLLDTPPAQNRLRRAEETLTTISEAQKVNIGFFCVLLLVPIFGVIFKLFLDALHAGMK